MNSLDALRSELRKFLETREYRPFNPLDQFSDCDGEDWIWDGETYPPETFDEFRQWFWWETTEKNEDSGPAETIAELIKDRAGLDKQEYPKQKKNLPLKYLMKLVR